MVSKPLLVATAYAGGAGMTARSVCSSLLHVPGRVVDSCLSTRMGITEAPPGQSYVYMRSLAGSKPNVVIMVRLCICFLNACSETFKTFVPHVRVRFMTYNTSDVD